MFLNSSKQETKVRTCLDALPFTASSLRKIPFMLSIHPSQLPHTSQEGPPSTGERESVTPPQTPLQTVAGGEQGQQWAALPP